ncbi:MAG: insulinase family protein [Clostridiales bacterium]|nr:insulinase family protein [Clostridiales bacterium]
MNQTGYDCWQLDNGLWVVAEPLSHLRSVSVGVWVGVGSANETKEENGLSHFIEHMVFKGTQKRSAKDFATQMDEVGGQLNAFTGKDCTCFYAKVIDENLPLAVDILSDLVLNGVFDKGELEKERGVIIEEIAMSEDDPEDLVHELLAKAQFADQSLGRSILGPSQQIQNYSRADLLTYQKNHYLPENAVISVAGNYALPLLKEVIEKYFGNWQGKGKKTIGENTPLAYHSGHFFHEKKTEQVHLCLGYEGRPLGGKNAYLMAMLNNLIGGGMSSLLFQRIREELGMAYSVYSYPLSYQNGGVLNIYAGMSEANALKVAVEIQGILEKLLAQGIDEKLFLQMKNQLRGSYLLGLENVSGRMQSLGRSQLLLGKINKVEESLALMESVTLEEITALCHRIFSSKPAVALVSTRGETLLKQMEEISYYGR